jgi:hypothetical protein
VKPDHYTSVSQFFGGAAIFIGKSLTMEEESGWGVHGEPVQESYGKPPFRAAETTEIGRQPPEKTRNFLRVFSVEGVGLSVVSVG